MTYTSSNTFTIFLKKFWPFIHLEFIIMGSMNWESNFTSFSEEYPVIPLSFNEQSTVFLTWFEMPPLSCCMKFLHLRGFLPIASLISFP